MADESTYTDIDIDIDAAAARIAGLVRPVTIAPVEPAGAHWLALLAAIRTGAYRPAEGEQVCVVLCGANTDPADLTS